jgi:alkaline phosphatase
MKKGIVITGITIMLMIFSGFTVVDNYPEGTEDQPQNIIFFIGDGMGVSHIYATMTISSDMLFLEKFPYTGFNKTYSVDNYVTDSGAGGTALACGITTKNGMIGVRPDSTPVPSITEVVHEKGLATGVVSTSSVTHATPASFVAHNANRNRYEEIATDFLNGSIDIFMGGGENNFNRRRDGSDLTIKLKEQGFSVVYSLDELKNTESAKIAALLAEGHMLKVSEGRGDALSQMTQKAIESLSKNDNGFFLMVEGSMIDWGGHDNDFGYITSEMIDLDNAIGVALDYAEKNGNTLIVVTADHETGGLTLPGGSLEDHTAMPKFSTGEHTGVMVPVFSYGPGAERFSGIHENTFFFGEFLDLLNIEK